MGKRLHLSGASLFSLGVTLAATALIQNSCAAATAAIVERKGIAYADNVPNQKHQLDVFAPAKAHDAPVVVLVHGGAWATLDRKDYAFLGRSLAAEGFVVVVPSYRLWPTAKGPQMADDVANATAWALRHAVQYGGKPNSVIFCGHSAGAHLAALVALDPRYLAKYQLPAAVVHGVIAISGIDDLRYLNGPVVYGAFGSAQDQRWNFSPVKYARRDAPPFDLICAQGDARLFCAQALMFLVRLRMSGATAEYYMAPGGHSSEILGAASPVNPLHLRIVRFVRTHA